SPLQPLFPEPSGLLEVPAQLQHVSRDAVVGVVPYKLRRQPGALPPDRPMPVDPTPVVDGAQCAGKPALGRALPHHLPALLRPRPRVGKAEKVERWSLAVWIRATWPLRPEVDEARLVGVERKPVPFKPLPQNFQHPFGIV